MQKNAPRIKRINSGSRGERAQKERTARRTDWKPTPSDCQDLHLFSSAIHAKELIGKRNSKDAGRLRDCSASFFVVSCGLFTPH